MFHPRRAVLAATAAFLIASVATSVAVAQTEMLGGKLRAGDTVTVGRGETLDYDLYAFGGTIAVDGTVNGDVVAMGGDVSIGGTINGDLVIAGGTVTVNGLVEGDVRVAAGQLAIGGSVGEDVLLASGQATINGQIGQDLIFWAGQVGRAGSVGGNIVGGAGEYSGTGSVGGDEDVTVGEEEPPPARAVPADRVADGLRQFVVVVAIGALGLWLAPLGMRAAEAALRWRPLASLGSGLLAFLGYIVLVIVALVAMVLLAIVLGLLGFGGLVAIEVISILLAIGVVTVGYVIAIAFVADAIMGLVLGRLVAPRFATNRWQELALLAGGAAAVVILTSLPGVGGWLKLLVIVLGLGGIALAGWRRWRAPAATGPAPAGTVPTGT